MPKKIKGKRLLKNGKIGAYVLQKNNKYKWKIIKGKTKMKGGLQFNPGANPQTAAVNNLFKINNDNLKFEIFKVTTAGDQPDSAITVQNLNNDQSFELRSEFDGINDNIIDNSILIDNTPTLGYKKKDKKIIKFRKEGDDLQIADNNENLENKDIDYIKNNPFAIVMQNDRLMKIDENDSILLYSNEGDDNTKLTVERFNQNQQTNIDNFSNFRLLDDTILLGNKPNEKQQLIRIKKNSIQFLDRINNNIEDNQNMNEYINGSTFSKLKKDKFIYITTVNQGVLRFQVVKEDYLNPIFLNVNTNEIKTFDELLDMQRYIVKVEIKIGDQDKEIQNLISNIEKKLNFQKNLGFKDKKYNKLLSNFKELKNKYEKGNKNLCEGLQEGKYKSSIFSTEKKSFFNRFNTSNPKIQKKYNKIKTAKQRRRRNLINKVQELKAKCTRNN